MTDPTQTALFSTETPPPNGHPAPANFEAVERPGYQFVKRIGWIPDDWEWAPLKSVVQSKRKITYGIVQPGDYDETGSYLVRGKDYSKGWDRPEELFRVSAQVESKYGRSRLQPGDLLMTIVGANTGTVAVVPDWLDGANITQTTARIAIDPEKAEPAYFEQYLQSDEGQRSVYRYQKGGAQPGLNLGDIKLFAVPLPPLPEQREIARVLGAWDRALADLDALVEAKRQRARGLAQRLLTGRARLPGFGNAEMVETNIGSVPSDWRSVRFGKVFAKRSEKNAGSAINHVITVGKYAIRPQSEHFDKSVASADRSNYNVIRPGDFVYDPMSAYYGAIGRYDSDRPGIVSPVYRVLTLRGGFDSGFVKHLLDAHYVRHRIASYSTQGNKEGKRRGLQHSAFNAIPVYVPSEDEQRQIAAVLDAAEAEVAAHEAQRAALAAQKRGLMQRLLTGEVRVTPSHAIASESG